MGNVRIVRDECLQCDNISDCLEHGCKHGTESDKIITSEFGSDTVKRLLASGREKESPNDMITKILRGGR